MLTMEMVLHKEVDFAPKFGKSPLFFLKPRGWILHDEIWKRGGKKIIRRGEF